MRPVIGLFVGLLALSACSSASTDPQGAPSKHEETFGDDDPPSNADQEIFASGTGGDPGQGAGGSAGTGGEPRMPSGGSGGAYTGSPAACANWPIVARSFDTSATDANSMIAPARAREWIGLGYAPLPTHVRSDDFFNYYPIDLGAQNDTKEPIVQAELRARAVPKQFDLFVGIQAPKRARPRTVLTILVDTTPSMAELPLARAKSAIAALGKSLKSGDSVVVFTTDLNQGTAVLEVGADPVKDLESAAAFPTESSQGDVSESLKAAYQSAEQRFDAAAQNRLMFISDGAEDASELESAPIAAAAETGIFLIGVGTGPTTTYRDRLLSTASRLGRGKYVYLDNTVEAERLFGDRFDELFGVAFDAVKLGLTLPWYFRLMEQAAPSDAANPPDQYLAPGATTTFLFRLEVCDPNVFAYDVDESIAAAVSYKGLTEPTPTKFLVKSLLGAGSTPALDKALAIKAYVDALRSVNDLRVEAGTQAASKALVSNPNDAALEEISSLLEAHPALEAP